MPRSSRNYPILAALTLAVSASTGSASASQAYPEILRQELGLAAAPGCTLCHANDEGGRGTVVEPFGSTMIDLGLVAANPGSLHAVIQEEEKRKPDSDFDAVDDLTELRENTDPNDGIQLPTPRTGCALAGDSAPRNGIAAAFGLLMAALCAGRRRAR